MFDKLLSAMDAHCMKYRKDAVRFGAKSDDGPINQFFTGLVPEMTASLNKSDMQKRVKSIFSNEEIETITKNVDDWKNSFKKAKTTKAAMSSSIHSEKGKEAGQTIGSSIIA